MGVFSVNEFFDVFTGLADAEAVAGGGEAAFAFERQLAEEVGV